MAYRAKLGGHNGSGVHGDTKPQIDIGGAIESVVLGLAHTREGQIRRAMMQQEQARQAKQDQIADEDRARRMKFEDEDRALAIDDRAHERGKDQRDSHLKELEMRSKGLVPARAHRTPALGSGKGPETKPFARISSAFEGPALDSPLTRSQPDIGRLPGVQFTAERFDPNQSTEAIQRREREPADIAALTPVMGGDRARAAVRFPQLAGALLPPEQPLRAPEGVGEVARAAAQRQELTDQEADRAIASAAYQLGEGAAPAAIVDRALSDMHATRRMNVPGGVKATDLRAAVARRQAAVAATKSKQSAGSQRLEMLDNAMNGGGVPAGPPPATAKPAKADVYDQARAEGLTHLQAIAKANAEGQ